MANSGEGPLEVPKDASHDEIMRLIDSDGDGLVDEREFRAFLSSQAVASPASATSGARLVNVSGLTKA